MSLDPRRTREERALSAAAEEEVVPPLEPQFPFRRVEFDPFFFAGLTLTPRVPEAEEVES